MAELSELHNLWRFGSAVLCLLRGYMHCVLRKSIFGEIKDRHDSVVFFIFDPLETEYYSKYQQKVCA